MQPGSQEVETFRILRRETIVTTLALLVIAIALPFAIMDTIEAGRIYVFSKEFLQELPQRFTGPGRFRFILQPIIAILVGIRGGRADAKAGNPPYLFGLFSAAGPRRELLRSGALAIRNLVATVIKLITEPGFLPTLCRRNDNG